MKQLIIIIIWLGLSFSVSAQDTSDATVRKTAVSICNCLGKNHVENAKDQAEMQAIFLQCMIDSAATAMGDLVMNSENGDYQKAGEEFAQKIAMELMRTNCKSFIQMSIKMAQGNGINVPSEGGNNPETESVKTVDGVVTNVEEKDFLNITVKTSNGREFTFIYLDYVDNSDNWVKDPSGKLKGKNITVQFIEKEVYQPKLHDFGDIKVLRDLKIKKN